MDTFSVTLEGFGPQVGDAVTLQVLRPGEGFPTTLLGADEATIVIVFSEENKVKVRWGHATAEREGSEPHLYRLCRSSLDILVKDQPHPSQSQMKGRSPANTSPKLI